ncbi:hypothetical protein BD779DRAFT_1479887 [Infundibulicybe gibba]|nr:hypothetical protein BD779DRAFT_1479887 [Infundibulicybe gibba]
MLVNDVAPLIKRFMMVFDAQMLGPRQVGSDKGKERPGCSFGIVATPERFGQGLAEFKHCNVCHAQHPTFNGGIGSVTSFLPLPKQTKAPPAIGDEIISPSPGTPQLPTLEHVKTNMNMGILTLQMHPLSLHTSALSDAEYSLYTSSLANLNLTPNTPRTVSTNPSEFFPDLAPGDTRTGGRLFATLRMVVHVKAGKEVDRALAFPNYVQSVVRAQPNSNNSFRACNLVSPDGPSTPLQVRGQHVRGRVELMHGESTHKRKMKREYEKERDQEIMWDVVTAQLNNTSKSIYP